MLAKRIISLLDEASNSFEQLETLANRFLAELPHDKVDAVELRNIEREFTKPGDMAYFDDDYADLRLRVDLSSTSLY